MAMKNIHRKYGALDQAHSLLDKAETAFSQDDLATAEQLATKAVQTYPRLEAAHFLLGSIAERTRDPHAAVEHITRGLDAQPGHIEKREDLIRLLLETGDLATAYKEVSFLLQRFPQHVRSPAWAALGNKIGAETPRPSRHLNACLVVPELVSEVDLLIDGAIPATTATVYALNTVIEAIVFHDILFVQKGIFKQSAGELWLPFEGDLVEIGKAAAQAAAWGKDFRLSEHSRPLSDILRQKKYLLDGPLSLRDRHPAYRLYTMCQQWVFFEGGLPLISLGTKQTKDIYEFYYDFIAEGGPQWYDDLSFVGEELKQPKYKCLVDAIRKNRGLTESLEAISRDFGLPLYANVFTLPFRVGGLVAEAMHVAQHKKLYDLYNDYLSRVCRNRGFSYYPVPPLTTIVLSQCKSRADVPDMILKVRDDFEPFRSVLRKHAAHIDEAENFGEQVDVLIEFDESWNAIVRKIKSPTTWLLHKAWRVVRGITPKGMVVKALDQLLEKDERSRLVARLQGLHDAWNLLRNGETAPKQIQNLRRLFRYEPSGSELSRYHRYLEVIEKQMFPEGR